MFFSVSFSEFLLISLVDLLILSFMVVLMHFPLIEYYKALDNENYKADPRKEFAQFITKVTYFSISLRKKVYATIIVATLFLCLAMVPLDTKLNLFTPSYIVNGETFSEAYPHSASDEICLFIYSNWTWNGQPNFTSEYRFYRLAQTQYTLFPAKLPTSCNLSISNPTRITAGAVGKPNSFSLWSDRLNDNVGSLYVNVSEKTEYHFFPNMYNISAVNFYLSPENKEPVSANMTYWKKIDANVSITQTLTYNDLGNGSYLESYTYTITNNEQVPLSIKSLDFDRLNWESSSVNANSTRIFFNGTDLYESYSFTEPRFLEYYRTLDLMNRYLGNGSTIILTLTFQSKGF